MMRQSRGQACGALQQPCPFRHFMALNRPFPELNSLKIESVPLTAPRHDPGKRKTPVALLSGSPPRSRLHDSSRYGNLYRNVYPRYYHHLHRAFKL